MCVRRKAVRSVPFFVLMWVKLARREGWEIGEEENHWDKCVKERTKPLTLILSLSLLSSMSSSNSFCG